MALSISGPASAKKGAQVTYVTTVSNAGPSTAHNVVLTDAVPSGASFLAVSTTRGTCSHPSVGAKQGTISCSLGDLASGGSTAGTITIKVIAKTGSTVANLASANSIADNAGPATSDPDSTNNTASVSTSVTK